MAEKMVERGRYDSQTTRVEEPIIEVEESSIEVPAEMGTQFDENLEMAKGDESYKEPPIIDSIHSSRYVPLGWLSKWRKGDDTTDSQQGVGVEETQERGSFTHRIFQRLIGGRTQKIDDPNTEQQDANACPSQERTAKPKKHKERGHRRSSRRADVLSKERCLVLTIALLTVLAGLKLGESGLLHWAVGNGYTGISKVLMKCGLCGIDAPNSLKETPLHVAAKERIQRPGRRFDPTWKSLQQKTPLHFAAWSGHLQIADVLIQNGSDVNARNILGQTPLHLAAENGHKHIAEVLIEHESDINARNILGKTPLHLAAENGHKQIAEVLIQHGSDINAGNDFGKTPVHLAAWSGHRNIAVVLIQYGSNVNVRNIIGQTPLHLAAANGHKQIAKALIQHGGDINAGNNLGQTPLHLAAANGHKQIAKALIQHGGDINAGNNLGQTPLHLAAENGHKQIAELLIQHGGDINDGTYVGQTPLHLAAENGHKQIAELLIQHGGDINDGTCVGQTPLHLAAENAQKQIIEFLMQHGSDVNARNIFGQTPLHLAAENGHKQIAEALIQHGGDINAGNSLGQTPLHLAAENGHKQIAELLIQHGGDINDGTYIGQTPLHLAAENAQKQIIEFLMQHGSDVNARNIFGQTPLHLAAENGHNQIAEILIQHGSDVNAGNHRGQMPLHLARENGHKQIAEVLIQHGGFIDNFKNIQSILQHLSVLKQYGRDFKDRDYFHPDRCQSTYNAHRRQTSGYSNHQVSIPCSVKRIDNGHLQEAFNHSPNIESMSNASLDNCLCVFSKTNSAKPRKTSGYPKTTPVKCQVPKSFLAMSNNYLCILSTSDRKTGITCGFIDKCIKNGINEVLTQNGIHPKENSYEAHHTKAAELIVAAIALVAFCFLLCTWLLHHFRARQNRTEQRSLKWKNRIGRLAYSAHENKLQPFSCGENPTVIYNAGESKLQPIYSFSARTFCIEERATSSTKDNLEDQGHSKLPTYMT
ncbi:hypothetical protein OS493_025680 [Desmophyllum pertusum]|uniref:Uncharacterized protein n=1 Tax=Desmophyllum pertusum TaxID=174260 RepID=A0A9W9ZMT8_9CNID|nr:hypothetical protein OS493_025680 [Desmophyllum pertusum]